MPRSGHTAAMRTSRARVLAVVGVVVAAMAAACLVIPASQRLATPAGLVSAAAILGIPIVLILAVSGYPAYGAARSMAVALVVALVTCAVSWIVVGLALGSALSGTLSTKTDIVLDIVVFGVPALCVLVVGLLTGRVVTERTTQRRASSASSSPA